MMVKPCSRCIKGCVLSERKDRYGKEIWVCINCGYTEIIPESCSIHKKSKVLRIAL